MNLLILYISFEGGKVKTNNINTVLESMGVKLSEKELDCLKENLLDKGKLCSELLCLVEHCLQTGSLNFSFVPC